DASHATVVSRVKAQPGRVDLFVCSPQSLRRFRQAGLQLSSAVPGVVRCVTPDRRPVEASMSAEKDSGNADCAAASDSASQQESQPQSLRAAPLPQKSAPSQLPPPAAPTTGADPLGNVSLADMRARIGQNRRNQGLGTGPLGCESHENSLAKPFTVHGRVLAIPEAPSFWRPPATPKLPPKPPASVNSSATAAMLLRMPAALTASAHRPSRAARRQSLASRSRCDLSDRATATEPSRQLKHRQIGCALRVARLSSTIATKRGGQRRQRRRLLLLQRLTIKLCLTPAAGIRVAISGFDIRASECGDAANCGGSRAASDAAPVDFRFRFGFHVDFRFRFGFLQLRFRFQFGLQPYFRFRSGFQVDFRFCFGFQPYFRFRLNSRSTSGSALDSSSSASGSALDSSSNSDFALNSSYTLVPALEF
uniref:WH2 domain-containing protein n=1 Tax=Macrostomum lignano TaxID=282301 RepID=A0A1I8FMY3_9PLAT